VIEFLYRTNDFAEISKNLAYRLENNFAQNNYVGYSSVMNNTAKKF